MHFSGTLLWAPYRQLEGGDGVAGQAAVVLALVVFWIQQVVYSRESSSRPQDITPEGVGGGCVSMYVHIGICFPVYADSWMNPSQGEIL